MGFHPMDRDIDRTCVTVHLKCFALYVGRLVVEHLVATQLTEILTGHV